jgi:hypothetical protein
MTPLKIMMFQWPDGDFSNRSQNDTNARVCLFPIIRISIQNGTVTGDGNENENENENENKDR